MKAMVAHARSRGLKAGWYEVVATRTFCCAILTCIRSINIEQQLQLQESAEMFSGMHGYVDKHEAERGGVEEFGFQGVKLDACS